jgi:hypothetical protein
MLKIVQNLGQRDLKRYRLDAKVISDWIVNSGVQKYQYNFIKIFGTEIVSFNELNLAKCINISLKSKG